MFETGLQQSKYDLVDELKHVAPCAHDLTSHKVEKGSYSSCCGRFLISVLYDDVEKSLITW